MRKIIGFISILGLAFLSIFAIASCSNSNSNEVKTSENIFETITDSTATNDKYTVEWYDENGKLLKKDEDISYGTIPSFSGDIPTKEASDENEYIFKGWTPTQENNEYCILYKSR